MEPVLCSQNSNIIFLNRQWFVTLHLSLECVCGGFNLNNGTTRLDARQLEEAPCTYVVRNSMDINSVAMIINAGSCVPAVKIVLLKKHVPRKNATAFVIYLLLALLSFCPKDVIIKYLLGFSRRHFCILFKTQLFLRRLRRAF